MNDSHKYKFKCVVLVKQIFFFGKHAVLHGSGIGK